jgi:hypothetical protein
MPHNDPAAGDAPLSFERILEDEYRFLHGTPPGPAIHAEPASGGAGSRPADVHTAHARAGHSALCLSGGGIRSASFNLGVLQGLAQAGVLARFDYLSTVSGGGYIGGWLTAWRARAAASGAPDPVLEIAAAGTPLQARDPDPVLRLRRNIRFLDPHAGARSVDVWTLGTIILRNLLLIWAVLLPFLAAGALLPRLYLGVLGLPSQPELVSRAALETWYFHDWMASLLLFGVAALYAALELPSLGNKAHGQRSFVAWFLVPVVLGESVVSVHRYWAWRFEGGVPLGSAVLVAAIGMALPWIVGGFLSRRWWRPRTWLAAAAAGAIGRAAIWSASHALTEMARFHPQVFAAVDLPLTLGLVFLQITLFAGLASRDMTDADREWWGRAAAWILMFALAWLATGALVLFAPVLLSRTFLFAGVSETAGRIWLALLTVLSGGVASRLASARTALTGATGRWVTRAVFVAAAPVLVLLLALLLATADLRLLEILHGLDLFHEVTNHPAGGSLPEDLIALGALLLAGGILSRLVSVNDFSLHGMYRQRLTRTFLGASRLPAERRPNPFTGFDPGDDMPMHETAVTGRPLHVVNATLNLVAENTLALQDRRAESFTISALHAGACRLGYRPSRAFGGGIPLGDSVTISGAAVSPNMGAASRPALTFLLTLFNARLGAWLANPGPAGAAVWRRPHRAYGAAPLLDELFGRTSDSNPYVYLSDGGHFENLGLYEMVRRRCRFIVVSDAGCDPQYRFDDLANAIRKIRIDFGIDIEFPGGIGIAEKDGLCPGRTATGRIGYSSVDACGSDGVLLYVKAAICGDEPVDVANYAAAHPPFPHQTTADQWFGEAQFESYRMLGLHSIATLTRGRRLASVEELCADGLVSADARAASGPGSGPASHALR